MSARDKQVGGSHYKDMAIQPVEFITRNNLGFLEGCVIKRVCRWRTKDGVQDLRKAIHELELLIEQEGCEETPVDRDERERLAVKLGHPMTGDRLTTSAEQAVRDFVKAHPEALRGEITRSAPAADLTIPGYCVPEGENWPRDALDGTRIMVWRPRDPGALGYVPYGWVEIGFMWQGSLVRHPGEV